MPSEEITRQIEELEQTLSQLRSTLDADGAALPALEQELGELRERLAGTRERIEQNEALLARQEQALAEARRLERLERYDEDLAAYREASGRVSEAAATLLSELERYDNAVLSLRRLANAMRLSFGEDERVQEVEAALAHDAEAFVETWEALLGATKWRLAEASGENGQDADVVADRELTRDLQDRTAERTTARILDYFHKS